MKRIIATAAALLTTAGAAQAMDGQVRASQVMGNPIYSTGADDPMFESDWDGDTEIADIAAIYTDIGSIEDLVMTADGQVTGLVAEVGGFLDMGDKHVMLHADDVRIVHSGGEAYYVTRLTEEQLEARDAVGADWMQVGN